MRSPRQKIDKNDKEYRFKQLEFLMKVADTETANAVRGAHLLLIGNASAVGVGILILKDLDGKFGERWILAATLAFVVGVALAANVYISAHRIMTSARVAIKDYIFDQEDISPLQKKMDDWDSPKEKLRLFAASVGCFLLGVGLILSQVVSAIVD